ncbi:DUF4176 domain-containing protein [Clostridium sp. SHJSY1]|uniref:DUF4176 domain-containing protein n=1 Tax=Clostridium sp. SHJSY1 TaxID=2942483 RepID=UPI002876D661|nr:DUF4176 domain-containing protein [Clostridium sp. SHJSY1]MDS0526681.1 DUF4176 domain-containing protein [Clostridium sp. SHJSY1]
MLKINNRELTESLISSWLDNLQYLDNFKKKYIYDISCDYYDSDLEFLYEINRIIHEKEETCEDNVTNLVYLHQEDKHLLIYKEVKLEFTCEEIKEIIFGLIDILGKIYPLGTTVELKKEYIGKRVAEKDVKNAQVVIVNRFISHEDAKSFFQYSAVVYPIGFVGEMKVIHFTSALIDKVLKAGYSDEKEEAYVYLMKKELIVDKRMHSFGFSTDEERESFERKLGVENSSE